MYLQNHRNSQRRIYIPGATYFITGITKKRLPYFKEEIFCKTFSEDLKIAQVLKNFKLYGWFLGYDHFHLLIKPSNVANYSELMRSLKTNVSCDINRIMQPDDEAEDKSHESEMTSSRFHEIYRERPHFFDWKTKFLQKHPNPNLLPKFQWQRSFHDHVIRDKTDFINHLKYIAYNPIKHNMPKDWPYAWVNNVLIQNGEP